MTYEELIDTELMTPKNRSRLEQYMKMSNEELTANLAKITRGKIKNLPSEVELKQGNPLTIQKAVAHIASFFGLKAGKVVGAGTSIAGALLLNPTMTVAAFLPWLTLSMITGGALGSYGAYELGDKVATELTTGNRVRKENKKRAAKAGMGR